MSDAHDLRELEKDPRLFLYTSLTAGSSHIITATSRLETILKANKVPFQAIDVATDEKARRLWQRRAGKRKLPGLVKEGFVLGDLEEVEEWNEYGELKENIGTVPGATASVPAPKLPVIPTATAGTTTVKAAPVTTDLPKRVALPGAAEIAARNNPLPKSSPEDAAKPETMSSAPAEKEKSIEKAIKFKGEDKHVEHLSAPASAIPSERATPEPAKTDADVDKTTDKPESTTESTAAGAERAVEEAATVNVEADPDTSSKPTGDVASSAKADEDVTKKDDSKAAEPTDVFTTKDDKAAPTTTEVESSTDSSADSPPATEKATTSDLADRTKPTAKESKATDATTAVPQPKADAPADTTVSTKDAPPESEETTTASTKGTSSAVVAVEEPIKTQTEAVKDEDPPVKPEAVKANEAAKTEAAAAEDDEADAADDGEQPKVPEKDETPETVPKTAAAKALGTSTTVSETQKQEAGEPELAAKSVED